MLIINAQQVTQHLPFDLLVEQLQQAFCQQVQVPLRHVHHIEVAGSSGDSLIMPAWSDQGYYGVKIVNVFPNNRSQSLSNLHASYLLFSATTGETLALLDGDVITARRTAAAAALAAKFLARQDAQKLLILGVGSVGQLLPAAFSAVRKISQVAVWNRSLPAAQDLVAKIQATGIKAEVVTDLAAAIKQADIISCATLSQQPLIKGQWLQPGCHLDLIGSYSPTMKETDVACFIGNQVFADTEEATIKSGDLLEAFNSKKFSKQDIQAYLKQLCNGLHQGRQNQQDITVFKAVGTAIEDLAAATMVYQAVRS